MSQSYAEQMVEFIKRAEKKGDTNTANRLRKEYSEYVFRARYGVDRTRRIQVVKYDRSMYGNKLKGEAYALFCWGRYMRSFSTQEQANKWYGKTQMECKHENTGRYNVSLERSYRSGMHVVACRACGYSVGGYDSSD